MVVSLLTRETVVAASKKSGHFSDDIIVIVVHVQINLLVFLGTRVDYFIAIFFRHDTDLVFGQVRLELFGLLNPAQSEWYVGVVVEFLCQTHLHRPTMIRDALVVCIVMQLGFGDNEGSRQT